MHELVVCDAEGSWAGAVARAGAPLGLSVRHLTEHLEAEQHLASTPQAALALAASAFAAGGTPAADAASGTPTAPDFAALLTTLRRWRHRWPAACLVVLVGRERAGWDWPLREAGASHVVVSQPELPAAINLVQSHWRRTAISNKHWTDEAWQALPWPSDVVRGSERTN